MDYKPRQALVIYLAEKYGPTGSLGKKAVQKYIHILSSLAGRSFGYDFSFYTYGAFSRELASDLDLLSSSQAISVAYNSNDNAYSITSTPYSSSLIQSLSPDIKANADEIWSKFAGRTAKQLELTSTVLFILDEENISLQSKEMTERVRALKPKYSSAEIKAAQDELEQLVK